MHAGFIMNISLPKETTMCSGRQNTLLIMAGLAKFTVTSINGDAALTGERLFNKNRVVSVKEYGSGSFIVYRSLRSAGSVIHDEYIVSDSFSTVTDIFSDYADQYYSISVYDNPSSNVGDSTERIISAQDIVYGVPYGDSDSLLATPPLMI